MFFEVELLFGPLFHLAGPTPLRGLLTSMSKHSICSGARKNVFVQQAQLIVALVESRLSTRSFDYTTVIDQTTAARDRMLHDARIC